MAQVTTSPGIPDPAKVPVVASNTLHAGNPNSTVALAVVPANTSHSGGPHL